MIVSSETTKSGPYNGNGSTTAFSVTFAFYDDADIDVWLIESDGTETLQTLTTHYTVAGGDGTTGTVNMVTAPASGEKLIILRDETRTQGTDYIENDPFSASVHEERLDRMVMMHQELDEKVGRAPKFKLSSTLSDIAFPEAVADGYVKWDSAGTALETDATVVPISNITASDGQFIVGDGSTWVGESGNTARTSLGLGSGDSPTFANLTLSSDLKFSNGEGIEDSNDNELLVFQGTASAVNHLQITNQATGGVPILETVGDDTNVGLNFRGKGTSAYINVMGTSTSAGALRMSEDTANGSNFMAFKAPAAVTTSTTLILPDGDGTANQILKTNGSGVLSWTDAILANITPSDGQIIVGDGAAWVGESGGTARTSLGLGSGDSPTFSSVILNGQLRVNDLNGIEDTNGNDLLTFEKQALAVNYLKITNSPTGAAPILETIGTDANVGLNFRAKGTSAYINVMGTSSAAGSIRLSEDTVNGTNFMAFKCPAAVTTSTTLTLPDGDGTADQVLKTNGSGILSWTDLGSTYANDETIDDDNGNELLQFGVNALAQNHIKISNQVLGGDPKIEAVGDAVSIGLTFAVKGADSYTFNGPTVGGAAIRLLEQQSNGTQFVGLAAPASIGSSLTFTLPGTDGSSGDALTTNGSGTLSFVDVLRTSTDDASQAQMEAATSDAVYVAPVNQHWHPGHPKAWATFNFPAGAATLQENYNIASIADNGVGDVTLTIDTDFSTATYGVCGMAQSQDTAQAPEGHYLSFASRAVGSVRIVIADGQILEARGDTPASVMMFGDQ